MASMHVPKPQPIGKPNAPKTVDTAKPRPGAESVSIGGQPGQGSQAEPAAPAVKAAIFKVAGMAETVVGGVLPAVAPVLVNALSDHARRRHDRERYRLHLLSQLQTEDKPALPAGPPPVSGQPKIGAILLPIKRRLGEYIEGMALDSAEKIDQANRIPMEQTLPHTHFRPTQVPL